MARTAKQAKTTTKQAKATKPRTKVSKAVQKAIPAEAKSTTPGPSEQTKPRSVIDHAKYDARYQFAGVKTPSGRKSFDNGDEIAQMLRGSDLDLIYVEVAKVLDTTETELRTKYQDLNPGMQRMNLGNRMRGAARQAAKIAAEAQAARKEEAKATKPAKTKEARVTKLRKSKKVRKAAPATTNEQAA